MYDYHAERFVERGTHHAMKYGVLSIYATNTPCSGVEFNFDKYMLTMMLSGHKSILFDDAQFEFFPGTLYIPGKKTLQVINIPNASLFNPTKCLVLDIKPSFLEQFVREVIDTEQSEWFTTRITEPKDLDYFLINEEGTIDCFKRLYQLQLEVFTRPDELIVEMALKELLLRIFKTQGRDYLLDICYDKAEDNIQKTIFHIRANLAKSLTIDELANIAGVGKTNYFHKFKKTTGLTPVNFILKERIEYAKDLIKTSSKSLQTIAYQSGFNTYEHFCKSFKRREQISPLKFRKGLQGQSVVRQVQGSSPL